MDNVGEIAYLIIAVLVFLAQAIFGKKKKGTPPAQQKQPAPAPQENHEQQRYEEWWNEQEDKPTAKEKTVIPDMPYEGGNVVTTERPQSSFEQQREALRKSSRKKTAQLDGLPFNDPKLQVEELENKDSSRFDLRQAIIHQVILERKFKV